MGCGSGYHLWRMIGAGAHLAVGIDSDPLFLCQFEAVRKLLGNDQRAHLLPLGIEQLPAPGGLRHRVLDGRALTTAARRWIICGS